MDPFKMMHIKPALEQFAERHPRFVQFLGFASGALQEGSLLEISIKDPEGKRAVTNLRVSAEDAELMRQLGGLLGKK